MNAYRAPFALLTLVMLVAVLPAAMWFVNDIAAETTATEQFLVTIVPVAIGLLTLASWIEPR